jgi:hypothetical protein
VDDIAEGFINDHCNDFESSSICNNIINYQYVYKTSVMVQHITFCTTC